MKRLLAMLMLCALCLCGCVSRQLEEELLVIVLGVDADAEQNILLTVKVPSSAAENKGEAGGGSGYLLFSAGGHGFADALAMLRSAAPRQLNFSQVREIVFGDQAARRADFNLLLAQIDAIPRFRCSAAVIVCREEARAFAAAQKPDLGVRLSRYADVTLSDSAGKGFTPNINLCKTLRDLGTGFEDPLLILGALGNENAPGEMNPENVLDALPGQLPRQGASAIEMFGAAATDGVCVSGYLTGYEMALVHLAQGGDSALTLRQEAGVPLHITARAPARLTAELQRSPALLRMELTCEVHYPPGHPPDAEALKATLEGDMKALLARLQALRCDGMGFCCAAVRQFLTVREWEALGWREVYAAAETEIRVTVTCREG